MDKNRIIIFDTSLHDGVCAPSDSMTFDDEPQVPAMLEKNGQGADMDTPGRLAWSCLKALKKLLVKREKTAPEGMTA